MKALLFGLIAIYGSVAIGLGAPGVKLRDFQLTDQHAKTRLYHFPKTKVTIMAVADYGGAAQLEPWIQRIYDRYQWKVDIDGVADVSIIPKLLRPLMREAFKKQLTYSVMLDWDGSVVSQFAYKKNVANIYLIDRSGRVASRFTGEVNDEALGTLFREIDAAIATARPDKPVDF
jgi:hypothetical protein